MKSKVFSPSFRVILPGAIFLAVAATMTIYTAMTDVTNTPALMMFILPALGFCCCLAYGVQPIPLGWLIPLACIAVIALVGFVFRYPIFFIPNFLVFLFSPFCGPVVGYLMGRAYQWAKKD